MSRLIGHCVVHKIRITKENTIQKNEDGNMVGVGIGPSLYGSQCINKSDIMGSIVNVREMQHF